jgi:hypothetical protein
MRRVLLLTSLLSLASGCATVAIPAAARDAVNARHGGHVVELRQSVFYGDLYDENELWLLSPYPFADTFHLVDRDGAPIHPQGQRGIFAAGTAFVLERIEFTSPLRMITSPRYNPWVYLTPAPGTLAPSGRRYFILLLPMDLTDEAGVEKALAAVVAPQGEVTRWLAARRPMVRAAIENKDVTPGMSLEELSAAVGPPVRFFADSAPGGGRATVAWYPSREVWLVDGGVTEVRPARVVTEPASATAPVRATAPAPAK